MPNFYRVIDNGNGPEIDFSRTAEFLFVSFEYEQVLVLQTDYEELAVLDENQFFQLGVYFVTVKFIDKEKVVLQIVNTENEKKYLLEIESGNFENSVCVEYSKQTESDFEKALTYINNAYTEITSLSELYKDSDSFKQVSKKVPDLINNIENQLCDLSFLYFDGIFHIIDENK